MGSITVAFSGIIIGIINALFGAGGGTVAVPFFKRKGKTQKEAQASAIALILPLSILSAAVYYYKGYFSPGDALRFMPFSVLGGIVGSLIMKKVSDKTLKKVFSLLMIYLGARMIFKG